jgi:hypothetical protein
MAGLVPAIYVLASAALKTWMPATSAGIVIASEAKQSRAARLAASVWTPSLDCFVVDCFAAALLAMTPLASSPFD